MNQIGWFFLADFQRARAFQTRDQIRTNRSVVVEIPSCVAIGCNDSKGIVKLS